MEVKRDIIFDVGILCLCVVTFLLSGIESMVNTDSHHWGYMYVSAFDLKHGLAPYKQILIPYGYLTTLIHAFSLSVLGESIMSIGIVTGLAYALTFFLSYRVFLTFLTERLAFLSVLLIFLLHPYIIHPWANYFGYTFQLLTVLLLVSDREDALTTFGAGVALGLSFLCRISSVVSIVPPFVIYFGYELLIGNNDRRLAIRRIALFWFGFTGPVLWMLGILVYNHAWYDIYIQNKVIAEAWNRGVTARNFLRVLARHIIRADTWPVRDSRSICFSVVFFAALLTVGYCCYRIFWRKRDLSKVQRSLLLVSLVTLFGFLSSVHIHQIFRLITGSSLGLGVLVYGMHSIAERKKQIRPILVAAVALMCAVWAKSLFTASSSIYLPWSRQALMATPVPPNGIALFVGKRVSHEYYDFYAQVRGILSRFDSSYSVVNYTWDPLLPLLSNLERVQIMPFYLEAPFYLPFAEHGYRDEPRTIQQLVAAKKAILLTTKPPNTAGYKTVFVKQWSQDTPWWPERRTLYIAVPDIQSARPNSAN